MDDWLELAALAAARADVYRVLATALLAPPDEQVVSALLSDAVHVCLAPQEQMDVLPAGMTARTLEALAAEYYRLFVVPGPSYVRPFESVYMDVPTGLWDPNGHRELHGEGEGRRGLLWGASTLAVQQSYAQAGLALTTYAGQPPDHVGLELDFMACLCRHEGVAWAHGNAVEAHHLLDGEAAFLTDHLLRWIGQLAKSVAASDVSPFYPFVAEIATTFTQEDLGTIADLRQAHATL